MTPTVSNTADVEHARAVVARLRSGSGSVVRYGCPMGCGSYHEPPCRLGVDVTVTVDFDDHTAADLGMGCDHTDPLCAGRAGRAI